MRDRVGVGCALLLLALAGAFAWLTRHPETPWLDRAAEWPAVGPLAASFRDAWRQPPLPTPTEAPRPEIVRLWIPEPPEPPRDSPPRPAATIAVQPVALQQPPAPVDRSVVPPRPVTARAPDPARLARVETVLGAALHRDRLGPYDYLGDLEPPALWRALAGALDGAFRERTGLVPLGEPGETVVALSDGGRYRQLERLEPRLAGLEAGGHAVSGMAVVSVPGGQPEVATATLVHELAHLVGRRALGPALPPWLDEGLAEDLAWTPFDEQAMRFRWGEVGGAARREGARVELTGALAALDRLASDLGEGRLPALADLVDADWEHFVAGDRAALRYGQAMFFVRFLLDGGQAGRREAFRRWLTHVASGGASDRAALEGALGSPLAALEAEFRAYLAARKVAVVDTAIAALARPGEHVVR